MSGMEITSFSTQVVAEKSLTKKKVYRQTNKQTNIITEKAKTIYPLYTSYRGYNECYGDY